MGEAIEWSDERRAWMVNDKALIVEGLRSTTFSAQRSASRFGHFDHDTQVRARVVQDLLARWPMYSDGEAHVRSRAVVREAFARLDVADIRARVTAMADEHVATVAARTTFDGISDLARPVAVHAVRMLFDLDDEIFASLEAAGRTLVGLIGTDPLTPEDVEAGARAAEVLVEALAAIRVARCRGWMTLEEIAGEMGLGRDDLNAVAINVFVDGHEPIESVIATGLLRASTGRSIDTEAVIGDATPFQYCGRSARDDVHFGGTEIRAGERVQFRIGQVPLAGNVSDHLAFGAGPHACPGAGFARHVVRASLTASAARLGGFEPDPHRPPIWRPSAGYRGLKRLVLVRQAG